RWRRRPQTLYAVRNVVHHARLRRDGDAIADFQMSGKTGLSGEDDVFAELATAGDAHLRDDQGAFANFDVVRDLHEVINLRAFADDRRAERAAVNRHVVADDDVADLRHLAVNVAVLHVTEAVRTNHRAGVNAHALADFRVRINSDVRKQIHVVGQLAVVADKIAGLQDRPRADAHALADNTMRPDVRAGVHLGARRNNRRRVNSGGVGSFGKNSAMALPNAMRALGT